MENNSIQKKINEDCEQIIEQLNLVKGVNDEIFKMESQINNIYKSIETYLNHYSIFISCDTFFNVEPAEISEKVFHISYRRYNDQYRLGFRQEISTFEIDDAGEVIISDSGYKKLSNLDEIFIPWDESPKIFKFEAIGSIGHFIEGLYEESLKLSETINPMADSLQKLIDTIE